MSRDPATGIHWSRWVATLLASGSFVVSGASKFFDDQVTMPRLFEPMLDLHGYERVMLGLGGLEVALAVLLCLRWTRPIAAHGLLVLLLAFAATIALSVRDDAFLEDCGCGDPVSRIVDTHGAWTMLLRIAALAVAVVWAGIGAHRWRYLCGVCIAVLATLLVAEKLAHVDAGDEGGVVVARPSESRPGGRVPAIEVETLDGRIRVLRDVLGPGSAAIVMSPDCEHCMRSMSGWSAVHDARQQEGGALAVLTSTDTLARCREALDARGLEHLRCFGIREDGDVRRLGVVRLPHYLQVDADARITVLTGSVSYRPLSQSLHDIASLDTVALGAARKVLGAEASILATQAAGDPATHVVAVQDGRGRRFEAFVISGAQRASGSLEMVVLVDEQGVVVGTHALTYSFVEGGIGSMLLRLARIDGLHVSKATSLCTSLAIAQPEVAIWPLVADMLSRIRAVLAARAGDTVGK